MSNTIFSEQNLYHVEETPREKRNTCRLAMVVLIVVVIFLIVFSL
jgi:hypothetical protein